ncbi:MAG: bile acid:sodium symporter family protein [Chitinophagales bacterium]
MTNSLDQIHLNFSPESLFLLNICLGFIMFGVALTLKVEHFRTLFQQPKALITGLVSQLLLLPLLTFLLILLLKPQPSIALGMIMVAACPGGNISNFIALLAKGNVALSVGMTAFVTILATFLTPFNFAFWSSKVPETAELLTVIHLSFGEMLQTVLMLLGVPLIIGMCFAHYFPQWTAKISRPIRLLSIVFFAAFVVIAFASNLEFFLGYIHLIAGIVLVHNGLALVSGYTLAKSVKLSHQDAKTISIETGIQNSGLGLVLIFNFFGGLGGMAIVAAWWGIWHMVAGLSLAWWWGRKD